MAINKCTIFLLYNGYILTSVGELCNFTPTVKIPSPPVLVRIMTFSSSKLSNEQFESRKDGKYARYFPQFIQVLMQCIFIFMNKKLTVLFIEESLFSK